MTTLSKLYYIRLLEMCPVAILNFATDWCVTVHAKMTGNTVDVMYIEDLVTLLVSILRGEHLAQRHNVLPLLALLLSSCLGRGC